MKSAIDRFESFFQLDLVDSVASGSKDHVLDLNWISTWAILAFNDQSVIFAHITTTIKNGESYLT